PSPLMMAAVSSAAARFTSAQNTLAPSRAKVTAVALPLPQPGPIDPAPATSATLFLRRSMDDSVHSQFVPRAHRNTQCCGAELGSRGKRRGPRVCSAPLHAALRPGNASFAALRIDLAQFRLEYLAIVVLRQRLDKHIILRALEA